MHVYRFEPLLRRPDKRFHMLFLFEDAFVDVPVGGVGTAVDRPGAVMMAGGAIGGARRGVEVAGRMRERQQAADLLAGAGTAGQLAAATPDAELIPLGTVTGVALVKGRWKARRLEVALTDGRTLTYTYTESAHPSAELRPVFEQLVADRFRSEV